MKTHKIAKCPECCPTGGACFSLYGSSEWRCNNCGHIKPRKKYAPKQTITPSQQKVIDKLRGFGWTVETSFIGRNVWVTCTRDFGNPGQNLLLGTSCFGTIGPRGSFNLEILRLFSNKKVTDVIGMDVYLCGLSK